MSRFSTLIILLLFTSFFTAEAQIQNGPVAVTEHKSPPATISRYLGLVEMGFLYGKTEQPFNNTPTYLATPSILIFNGYRPHRMFAIGATTGFDFYENILIVPIGLGIRGTLLNSRVSPYYSLDTGHGATFFSGRGSGERPKGGWFVNPTLGFQVRIDNKTAFLFGLGLKQQRVDKKDFDWWGNTIDRRITYNRLSARMGFMF